MTAISRRLTRISTCRQLHLIEQSHIGASGDLAKKKTYPSLLKLFEESLLPEDTIIYGYARSAKSHEELRHHLFPHLVKTGTPEIIVKEFLKKCYYHSGRTYGDEVAYAEMVSNLIKFESECARTKSYVANRLFYLAVPPNVFGESGTVIKMLGMAQTGWTRVVIEKPFGRDLESCNELLRTLSEQFDEENMYRIDHYLGKEVVQNLLMFRFGNSFFETIWSNQTMESVTLTFKEVRCMDIVTRFRRYVVPLHDVGELISPPLHSGSLVISAIWH